MNESENTHVTDKVDYRLRPKQQLFADAVIAGKTQREAYLLAGYSCKDENGIASKASQLVSNSKIATYVRLQRDKLEKKAQEKFDLSQEERVMAYQSIIKDLQDIVEDADCDKRTKVAALKAKKDAEDSLTRIAGLFNDKLHIINTSDDLTQEDSVTLARIARGEVMTSQSN